MRALHMIEPYLEAARFLHVSYMDPTLISVLVERWRPETHTFHLLCDECTITLKDVQLQLVLLVDESVIIGLMVVGDWSGICKQQLDNVSEKF
ncbi:hypothetical protein J1N35_021396 [Gossypium stocksii]|uniref:Aminotransferase-like plant mobile domain-containing protein n=1 Tax=Gossypium stocksii TaxID=47602 RepID=A0A9D3VE50_9ROSI|nr:hypothetical protein J1N35_021396 [Gossypium stocksii]